MLKIEKKTVAVLSGDSMSNIQGGASLKSFFRNFGHWKRNHCLKKIDMSGSCPTHGKNNDACADPDAYCIDVDFDPDNP